MSRRAPFCSTCEHDARYFEGQGVLHYVDNQPVYLHNDTSGHEPDHKRWEAGELLPGDRVRHAGHLYRRAYREGTATVIQSFMHNGHLQYEVLLDDPLYPGADRSTRLTQWSAGATEFVQPSTGRTQPDACLDAKDAAWYDLPYPAVPPHTARGVTHKVVAIWGIPGNPLQHSYGVLVHGITVCGKGRGVDGLLLDRSAGRGMFRDCKRCWAGNADAT